MPEIATSYKGLDLGRLFLLPLGKRQIELRFSTTAREKGRVAVDLGDVADARLLQRTLRNSGFAGGPLTRAEASKLDGLIVRYSKSAKGRAALTPVRLSGGWNTERTSFALEDLEFPSKRPVARPPRSGPPLNSRQGTPTGWKSTTGKLATYSSRAMLMISSALAAPALALSGIETGGFGINIWGPSSTGKSSVLRAGASVLAGDFVGSWNGTALGLQDLAQEYCDLPLSIDSMESLAGEAQHELTESVAYTLGNGKARVRAKSWSATNGSSDASWRTVLLSTAEAKFRRAQKTGAAVRLIDVPVNANPQSPLGVVDYIPERITAEKHRVFAASLIRQMAKGITLHHGYVLPAFVAHLAKDTNSARAKLAAGRDEFIQKFGGNDLTNAEARVLGHFALVYAAGRLGIALGFLPWPEAYLLDAISSCATDALENSNDRAKRNADNAARVMAWVADPARAFLQYGTALTRAEILAADGLRAQFNGEDVPEDESRPVRLVLRHVLQQALRLQGKELTGAMGHLRKAGRLVCEDRPDTMTVQHRFRDFSARFYVLYT